MKISMSLLILQTTPLKKWIFTSKIANEQTYILTYQTTKKTINPPKFNQQQKSHDLPILRPNDAVHMFLLYVLCLFRT